MNWKKRNKYNAVKVEEDGYKFDSKAEWRRYCELKLLKAAGEIRNLNVHPTYDLVVNNIHIGKYTPDFEYRTKEGRPVVEDVKSKATLTADSRLRIKLFFAIYGTKVDLIGVDK